MEWLTALCEVYYVSIRGYIKPVDESHIWDPSIIKSSSFVKEWFRESIVMYVNNTMNEDPGTDLGNVNITN